MSTEDPEAKELGLVGKVELRIAMVSSDEKLQSMLNTYLTPLLLKLASEFVSVRNKVISVCQHINTRIKPPSIKLPVAALLKQFKETSNPLVRHFDLLYIQQSVNRLPLTERLDLLPTLIHGLRKNFQESSASAATLFNLFLKMLHHMKLPSRGSREDLDLRNQLGLADQPEDASFIAEWLGKLILFLPGPKRSPGLTAAEDAFLQLYGKDDTWKPTGDGGGMNLIETKVIASKFVASGAFVDTERYIPALFMSADTNSRVSDVGDDILKRASSAVSFEDPNLVAELYRIYLGTRGEEGSSQARIPLQTKILSLLCKSKLASSFIRESTQIVREALSLDVDQQVGANTQTLKKGLEASKLRNQVFAFTNWLARISSPSDLSSFAPGLVGQLRDYIESQGWPRPRTEEPLDAGEISSRAWGYESIGLLAGACPEDLLLDPNLDLLRWLFTSLSEDPCGKEVSISIEQALGSVLGAFGGALSSDLETALISLFSHHMSLQVKIGEESDGIVKSTRFMALKFTNRCLPYHNVQARYVNVLALCSDVNERKEVLDEGRRGLDPYWYKMLNPSKKATLSKDETSDPKYAYPDFIELISRFFGADAGWDLSRSNSPHIAEAYTHALSFCRNTLLHQVLESQNSASLVDTEWEGHMDALIANNEDARWKIREGSQELLNMHQGAARALRLYLHACFNGMVYPASSGAGRAGEFLIEICPLLPASEFVDLTVGIEKLQESIFSTDKIVRERSAHVFGVLASFNECPEVKSRRMIKNFEAKMMSWEQAIGSDAVKVHGSILAIAYFFSRCNRRHNVPVDVGLSHKTFVETLILILKESRDKLLQEAVFVAISELAVFDVLTGVAGLDQPTILEKLLEKAKEGNEKAIMALGHLAMQCQEEDSADSFLKKIINHLYDLHTVRQPEVQFAVGAALTCAASGWQSKYLVSAVDIEGPTLAAASRKHTLSAVLEKVLSDCKTSKPGLRQASVIWLLCLVQYCGHLADVQSRLRACQAAFMGFLADRESLNQESASRGLTIVYEKGGRELKDDLIRDLVSSFTGTTSNLAGGKVSEDTELFDQGALPTGDGSITTYKDIMSLAAEVGDSSLVYRFMSLASNNAIWSSRAAFGRFGLSNILNNASTDGYLAQNPKLYPALFRYRFDPNSNVRNAMNDIWLALVKEPTATINAHFDTIIHDLLKNILGKEWRVRQASCAAIADLVQGRPLEMYEKYLNDIWTVAFKVCDDIKESVRAAAMALARVLTGILTRGLEAGDSAAKTADRMLKQVLPFLLGPSGLESGAPEVQDFSRKTILEIIKKGNGKTLRPFVPELVGRLLALLSSIEPEMINYVHLNAEKYGVTAEQLDDARLKHIRGSKMLESIERCLDFLDEGSMTELQHHLENAIKTVIGLPSKVGCSRVLVSLSTRQNFIFKPYADVFLPLARKQVFDRNDTISSSYAAACGYLARLASDDALLDLMSYCRKLYVDSDDDRHRVIAGDIVHAVSKHATDRFNSIAGEAFPFVFVAKHDTFEKARLLFEDTWSENVGGSRAVLLYLKEIVDLALQYLDSARWSIKHTSAFTIADVVTSSGSSIGEANAMIIWPALEKALVGKTWDGKEKVLKAFVLFAKNSTVLSSDPQAAAQMDKIMFREAQRNNTAYLPHAMECLGDFVALRKDIDLYDQVRSIVTPVIEELSGNEQEEDMDVDSKTGGPSSKTIHESTLTNATTALLKAINPSSVSNEDALNTHINQIIDILNQTNASGLASNKTLQSAICESLKDLFERLLPSKLQLHESTFTKLTALLFSSTTADQVEHVRLKTAEAAVAMAHVVVAREKVGGGGGGGGEAELKRYFAEGLEKMRGEERSVSVMQKLGLAKRVLDGEA